MMHFFDTFKYSSGKLIYSNQSTTHLIEVRENWRYRWFHFGGPSIQSVMKKRAPAELALPYLITLFKGLAALSPAVGQVTLLGVGGAAIIRHARKYYPLWRITGVEVDPAMIEMSARYFGLPEEDERLTIYVADAADFLHHPPHPADLIISDIYLNEKLPDIIHQNHYYEMLHAHLSAKGLLCLNIVYEHEVELLGVTTALQSVFNQQTLMIKVAGYRNAILFASKNPKFADDLQSRRNEFKDFRLDSLYGYMAVLK